MTAQLNVVVAGAPALAEALRASGRFVTVFEAANTAELRTLVRSELGSQTKDSLLFVFASDVQEDSAALLKPAVSKLSTNGWKVAILETSPNARDLVVASPGAGLLPAPFSTNTVLGALSGLGNRIIEPVPERWGFAEFEVRDRNSFLHARTAADAPTPSAPTPAAPEWGGAPAAPSAWDQAQAAPNAWDQVAPAPQAWDQAPAAPNAWDQATAPGAPSTWDQAPAAPGPWDQSPAAPATPTPAPNAWDQVAPAPQTWDQTPAAPATPAPATPAPAPNAWDQNAPAPQAWDQTPAAPAPWDTPAPAPTWDQAAPAAPSAATAWDTPTPAAPGWGEEEAHGWPAPPPPMPGTDPAPTGWGTATAAEAPQGWGNPAMAATWEEAPAHNPQPLGGIADAMALPQRQGLVISVTVPKGGAGKSSLAINLGVYLGLRLREQGATVCVVDANYQQADVGKYINCYTPNIATLVRAHQDLTPERITKHLLYRPDLHTTFLLGPATTDEANPLWITPALYAQAIDVLRRLFDYIIIDTPVAEFHHAMFEEFVLPSSDFILVPVAPNFPTIMNTDQYLRAVTTPRIAGGNGVDAHRIGVVLNRAEDDIGCSEDEVRAELASWTYLGMIPESKEWKRAANRDEIIATRNFAELNDAFSRILYQVTGEEALQKPFAATPDGKPAAAKPMSGFLGKLFGKKKS